MTSFNEDNRKKRLLPWITMLLVLIVSLWLRIQYLWVEGLEYDEGVNLMFALLVENGHPAYSETFVGIAPLALQTIQLGTKLFGTTLAIRFPMMLFGLVGIGSMFWLLRPNKDHFGLVAGLFAAVFLSFAARYFSESVSIRGKAAAVSMALLALVFVQQYYLRKGRLWLVLSGVAFGLSLGFKIFVVFFPIIAGVYIAVAVENANVKSAAQIFREIIIDGAIWGLGVAITLLVFVVLYDPVALYQGVLGFRFAHRGAITAEVGTFLGNIRQFLEILSGYTPHIIGTVLGAVVGWRNRRLDVSIWLLWLVLTAIILIWQGSLKNRYYIIFLPGFAALNGILYARCLLWLVNWDKRRGIWLGKAVAGFVVMMLLLFTLPFRSVFASPFLDPSGYVFRYLTEELRDAIDYTRNNTTVDDCVVTDDQRFAIAARRLVPPLLSETSYARFSSGWMITPDMLFNETVNQDCSMVIYRTRRFWDLAPQFHDKLRGAYFLEIKYDENLTVFSAKKDVTRDPEIPLGVNFGKNINLQGIDLTSTSLISGGEIRLATYWTALAQPKNSFKIFLQLRDEQDQPVANYDHFPFPAPTTRYQFLPTTGGLYEIKPSVDYTNYSGEDLAIYPERGMLPTNVWPVGSTIREVTTMMLPENLPSGTYYLYIGMYNPDTLDRLLVGDGLSDANELLLSPIEIFEMEN